MDLYQEITDRIINELEKGKIPWQKPWIASDEAVSHVTGKPYSLLNQLLLGTPGEYLTFNQVRAEGGSVKKGEKASKIVFWKFLKKEDEDDEEARVKQVPILRCYNVFRVDQCEGIEPRYVKDPPNTVNPDAKADSIISTYLVREGIQMNHEGGQAFYRPSTDDITIPEQEAFISTAEYYSTAFHEMVHSTGHEKRLNRLSSDAYFGNEEYSKEELVAEIGSAALVSRCGLETKSSFRNSTAYIQNWLRRLKDDRRLIVSAAGKAEKAVQYILG